MSLLRKLRRQADDKRVSSIALETLERRVLLNADLAIDAFDIDSPAAPPVLWGDSLTLAADIVNLGDADAGPFDSKIFLSEDPVLDGSDMELDTFSLGGLTAGSTSINDRVMSLPASGTDGDYHLILQTDTGDAVGENDENNNMAVIPFFIGDDPPPPPPGQPDLFAANVQGPANALPGDTFNVTYELHNPTNDGAGTFDVNVGCSLRIVCIRVS